MRALVILLCVAAWRGPLPWIHEHHAAEHADRVDPNLLRHLANYHTADGAGDRPWHVHFVVLWEGLPDEDCDDKSPHAQDPLLTGAVAHAAPALCSDWLGHATIVDKRGAVAMGGIEVTRLTATGERADSFLASLLATAPLRAVTGVALC